MKKTLFSIIIVFTILIVSCTGSQSQATKTSLSSTEYFEKIKTNINAPIIDVRTPDEFAQGHLARALNYNFNDGAFESQIASLDKSKPVFVYCLSGMRSSRAATQMRGEGFKEVYEMEGGMLKWRAAGLPETATSATSTGMSLKDYEALYAGDKPVLVDFYAEWCGPCKQMTPDLEDLQKTMGDKITFIRIDVDKNTGLTKELNIDALPTLIFYKNKQKTWQNVGLMTKADLINKMK